MTEERHDDVDSGGDAVADGTLGAGLRPTDAERVNGSVICPNSSPCIRI